MARDAAVCKGCAFGRSTPLEAARRPPQTQPGPQTPAPEITDGYALEGHDQYIFEGGALKFVTASLQGKAVHSKITSFPVKIDSVHIGEIQGDQHYYMVRHYKPHQGWRAIALKASQLHGYQVMAIMADLGVVVHDPVKFQAYVRDSVDVIHARERTKMHFDQFGWKDADSCFLFGSQLYTPDGVREAAISPSLKFRAQWLGPVEGGSVIGWKNAVDNLMGRGSEGMSFTVVAAFASLIMRFMSADEGGAIVNLMTRQSGTGKTTSLSGAYTVWASNIRGLALATFDTRVSQGITLGELCNLPCCYDEFDNKDPVEVRQFAVTFTNGRDRQRGTPGAHLVQNAASWQMTLLAASNRSIADTVSSAGESDAPAMRILELPIESSGDLSQVDLMSLSRQLTANAGHAGDAFLRYITQPGVIPWIKERLPRAMDEIIARGGFRKEHRFWVRQLAATAVAAAIIDKLGLISFSPKRIMDWSIEHFSNAPIMAKVDDQAMTPHLSRFINEHLEEILVMPGPSEGRKIVAPIGEKPRRKVVARVELSTDLCYIDERTLRQWLEKNAGGGYSDLLRETKTNGMLRTPKRLVTLTAGTHMHGGQVYCVGFDIGHPAFSGVVREAQEAQRRENVIQLRGLK